MSEKKERKKGGHLLQLRAVHANARTPANDLGGIHKVLERRVVHRAEGARVGSLLHVGAVLAALCPFRHICPVSSHHTEAFPQEGRREREVHGRGCGGENSSHRQRGRGLEGDRPRGGGCGAGQ